MSELAGKTIVLGVSGGVAAYKAAELVRLLIKAGARVHVVMTENGVRFVTPTTFQALSGNSVWTEAWDDRRANNMSHIELTRAADALLIAPATANILAKLANGLADDLLSTLVLARDCPLLVAPAMNKQMWGNPATQRNVERLRADGVAVIGPAAGEQACGEVGEGRMSEPVEIFEALAAFLQPKPLAGRRVLMTAGPTYEPIDPVRGITNISSGKMGYALARAFVQAGARVQLVSGPVSLPTPYGVERIDVQTAAQMHQAVMQHVGEADVFVGVAAVADYRPVDVAADKIKKAGELPAIRLERNPDILADVASLPAAPFCVGFAAESRDLDSYARGKLEAKRLQLVVGNLVQDGMGGDTNQVVLYDAWGSHPLPRASKREVAVGIVGHLVQLLATGG
ncbi:MAG: bifunctional phosphopantothenoylcysteine decarboxylase/phosphopantothenate--cysteine ligase CoaBC [Candidatus Dactylopiibacterium carminicum]|uniref:Coenzyme A biosynthesis bifunctional protein CoaBC n=1 Tax=Candidatus Dactylopiibacterium carminicum TaxID=857335 RepID=A0A272EU62_9RHOO|nr:bifunctional phosphopantothenoylcysteine decarboxylase/phosphopantothenate--cysteine ligase CoaBC [Candidatus Dactylopiibacterium carminicum]KAF7599691.1 bifunctional phosphopantothenoylcysteine decarboxylase/phosphopantothenate--cysteine ligase CoaBC [Candidatus Dactylopiibacterium carminicum]PAS93627.1 MAG: bifunctional phosphopantothenoylcysteine decarboxylase/phosphopantothenate--cysteine ligase CoaBC [Candidatus Dactylopiibacterium carminicum]PAS97494.1 MAG: bifunctional phosphopantothen